MPRSLARTLIARCSLVAVAALGLAVFEHFRRDGVELHYELDALAAAAQAQLRSVDGTLRLAPDAELQQWLQTIPDLHLAIVDVDERPIFVWRAAPGDRVLALAQLSEDNHLSFMNGQNTPRFGYVTRIQAPDGRPLRLVAERAQAELRDRWLWARTEILDEYGPFILGGALVSILVALFSVRRALAPLARASDAARAIEPGAPHLLDERDLPIEILPLVQAVNSAVGRLQEALEQQRRFTGDVAHTLRTPLAALRAQIEALEPGAERTGLLRSLARMERLVGQILTSARLDTAGREPPRMIDLSRVIGELVADAAPGLLAADRHPILELPDRPIEVRVPRLAVEHAVLNLLDNAAKASPAGGEIEVRLDEDGLVLVRDRGPGLAPDLLESLRAGVDTTRRSTWRGAGLGLSIVRKAVEAMGAELVARNRPGGGAEVGFRLARHEARNVSANGAQATRQGRATEKQADAATLAASIT